MHYFFYKDLKGRPRLRRYISAALAILILLAGMGMLGQAQTVSREAPSGNLQLEPSAAVVLAPPTAAPTPQPSPTTAPCPVDPEAWSFVEIFPDDHYRRIEPACVYAGVARTAAWMLLERMGYSKAGAAERLGFDGVPWEPVLSVYGFTNLKGPLDLALLSEWPAHPDFQFWQVDDEGRPALAASLRGCYRIPAGEVGVICVLALDRSPGSAVSVLGGLHIAHHALHLPGSRTFHLLEYAGGGNWVLLGQLDGLSLELEGIDQMEAERQRVSDRLGAEPWDAAWLFTAYGLTMEILPPDWRMFGMDEGAVQAIAIELNRYIPASLGETNE
jgi:hypothetical protein